MENTNTDQVTVESAKEHILTQIITCTDPVGVRELAQAYALLCNTETIKTEKAT